MKNKFYPFIIKNMNYILFSYLFIIIVSSLLLSIFKIYEYFEFNAQQAFDVITLRSNILSIIPTNGLIAAYNGESWKDKEKQWTDISGSNNHVTDATGIFTQNDKLNNKKCLSGVTNSVIKFPINVMQPTYTLIHVTKYNGNSKGRIFTTDTSNWLSGFWGGRSGVAYHEGWVTNYDPDKFGSKWVVSVDQPTMYRANRQDYSTLKQGKSYPSPLTINKCPWSPGENSDWSIACIIIYNRILTPAEISIIETWISSEYKI
jgi:hypothetical protein